MKSRELVSVDTLEAMLFARRLELIARLGINGRREGQYLVALNPTRADNKLGSFKINLSNGKWKDFSSGEGAKTNPMLALICLCATAGDFVKALGFARAFLGLEGREPDELQRAAAREAKAKADADEASRAETKRHRARRIWNEAIPLTGADPASLYLQGRAIIFSELAEGPPGCLRFHPHVYASDASGPYPALIAHVSLERLKGGLAGIHRIYLKSVGGRWVKARDGAHAKESLGSILGGSIRLTRGASGKPLRDAPAGEWVGIAEGIEDGLSVAIAMPHLRVLTPASLGNLPNITLPPQIGGVWLIAQNDPVGSAADHALTRAALGLRVRGLQVRIVRTEGFKDFNEMLQFYAAGHGDEVGGAA